MNSIQLVFQLLCQFRLVTEIITQSLSSGEKQCCIWASVYLWWNWNMYRNMTDLTEQKCSWELLAPCKAAASTRLHPPSPGHTEKMDRVERVWGTPHIGHQPDRNLSRTTHVLESLVFQTCLPHHRATPRMHDYRKKEKHEWLNKWIRE